MTNDGELLRSFITLTTKGFDQATTRIRAVLLEVQALDAAAKSLKSTFSSMRGLNLPGIRGGRGGGGGGSRRRRSTSPIQTSDVVDSKNALKNLSREISQAQAAVTRLQNDGGNVSGLNRRLEQLRNTYTSLSENAKRFKRDGDLSGLRRQTSFAGSLRNIARNAAEEARIRLRARTDTRRDTEERRAAGQQAINSERAWMRQREADQKKHSKTLAKAAKATEKERLDAQQRASRAVQKAFDDQAASRKKARKQARAIDQKYDKIQAKETQQAEKDNKSRRLKNLKRLGRARRRQEAQERQTTSQRLRSFRRQVRATRRQEQAARQQLGRNLNRRQTRGRAASANIENAVQDINARLSRIGRGTLAGQGIEFLMRRLQKEARRLRTELQNAVQMRNLSEQGGLRLS